MNFTTPNSRKHYRNRINRLVLLKTTELHFLFSNIWIVSFVNVHDLRTTIKHDCLETTTKWIGSIRIILSIERNKKNHKLSVFVFYRRERDKHSAWSRIQTFDISLCLVQIMNKQETKFCVVSRVFVHFDHLLKRIQNKNDEDEVRLCTNDLIT